MFQVFTFNMYQLVKIAEQHLLAATQARSYMRAQIQLARRELEREFPDGIPRLDATLSALPACSRELTIHLSFDFAQQVCHTCTYHHSDLWYTLDTPSPQPPAARPHLLPCPQEVRYFWGLLRPNTGAGKIIHHWFSLVVPNV